MRRRDFLKSAAAAAAATRVVGCRSTDGPAERPSGPPNIVFLFADQLRADMLGPYGGTNIETPSLDALAREGTTFDNALSTCPLCAPYRGMLMTGRYPTHSGVLLNRVNISPVQNPQCLAQVLGARGYDTGFLGKWHLSAGIKGLKDRTGDDLDADAYVREHPEIEFTPPGPQRLGFRHWEAYNYHIDFRNYWFFRDEPKPIVTGRYETDVLVDQAVDFMRQRSSEERPFLLVIAPHPPHPPFTPDSCPPGYLERVPETLTWRPNVPPQVAAELLLQVRCYLAMIRHLDDCVGRLVRFLDESGLSERTLLVVTSDHGEMHGSHGLVGKCYPFAESVNLPLLMRWPGVIAAGARSDALYAPFDHLPTFCSLAGADIPAIVDGTDLSEVLLGAESPRDAVLMMNYVAGYANFKTGGDRPEWRAVRTPRHTYVRWLDGHEALFDDAADPFQMHDLVATEAARPELDRLRPRLQELLARAHDEFLPGTAYADWYAPGRTLVRTALGPVA